MKKEKLWLALSSHLPPLPAIKLNQHVHLRVQPAQFVAHFFELVANAVQMRIELAVGRTAAVLHTLQPRPDVGLHESETHDVARRRNDDRCQQHHGQSKPAKGFGHA